MIKLFCTILMIFLISCNPSEQIDLGVGTGNPLTPIIDTDKPNIAPEEEGGGGVGTGNPQKVYTSYYAGGVLADDETIERLTDMYVNKLKHDDIVYHLENSPVLFGNASNLEGVNQAMFSLDYSITEEELDEATSFEVNLELAQLFQLSQDFQYDNSYMAIEIVIGPNNLSLDAYKFKMIDFVNYSSIGITISHPGMIAEMKKQIKDTNELPRILMHIESGHGAVEEYFVIDEEASSIGFSKN